MKLFIYALFFTVFGCSTTPEESNSISFYKDPLANASLYTLWIQNGCTLYRNDIIKHFPGERCIFLEDGRLISSTKKEIRMFSPSKEVLWEVKGHFHHQLHLSVDKQRILTLSSTAVKRGKKIFRDDVIVVFQLDGRILSSESIYPHLVAKGIKTLESINQSKLLEFEADFESSHLNSIYEIPENAFSEKIPWLQTGNIIVNSLRLGVFIFSPDLKKILHHKVFPFSRWHSVHDVQITPDGEYLLFNNKVSDATEARISAIQKFNDPENRMTFDFRASPQEMFYSPVCGGVQEVGDIIFFSHVITGGFFYSKRKKTIIYSIPGFYGQELINNPTQELKLVDVESFLKNSGN